MPRVGVLDHRGDDATALEAEFGEAALDRLGEASGVIRAAALAPDHQVLGRLAALSGLVVAIAASEAGLAREGGRGGRASLHYIAVSVGKFPRVRGETRTDWPWRDGLRHSGAVGAILRRIFLGE